MKNPVASSMTGYGRHVSNLNGLQLEVEVKSVNSRFLDINCKLPKVYYELESRIRQAVSEKIYRGRVDIMIQRTKSGESSSSFVLDQAMFNEYLAVYVQAMEIAGCSKKENAPQLVFDILAKRDVLVARESTVDIEAELPLVLEALEQAMGALVEMRQGEGASLYIDIMNRFTAIKTATASIASKAQAHQLSFKDSLTTRLKQLAPDFNFSEDRIVTEAAILADKIDITEEVIRLNSHISQLDKLFAEAPHGKKLDFLAQECIREVNTIGSKSTDVAIKELVLASKSELEKIREQLMNLE